MEDGVLLEESILTIADLKERFRSEGEVNRVPEADQSRASTVTESEDSLDVVMVDWNALPSEGPGKGKDSGVVRTEAYEGLSLTILGCIDHHDDEGFIPRRPTENPQHYEPRHIQTGVGSCTSLVVRELRSRGLWPDGDASETAHGQKSPSRSDKEDGSAAAESASHEAQAAKLALAAILIDTANMTAGSKVSDVDRAAVSFLEAKIRSGVALKTSSTAAVDNKLNGWDRETFYNEIQEAKSSSVENLTMDEVLGRDYKEWTESSQAGGRVKLGFCNVVKPLSWILKKANDSPSQSERRAFEPLFKHISAFSGSKDLDVVVLMTVFSGGGAASNDFHRELLVWDIRNDHRSELERFEAAGTKELGLESWSPEQEDGSSSTALPDVAGYCRVWKQTDVTKSRKQVAPLVRKALAGELSQ
jgi:exopolyphosphatase